MIENTKKEILKEARSLTICVAILFACVVVAGLDMYFKHYAAGIMLGIMAIVQVHSMDMIMDNIKLDLDILELHARADELKEMKKKLGIT